MEDGREREGGREGEREREEREHVHVHFGCGNAPILLLWLVAVNRCL